MELTDSNISAILVYLGMWRLGLIAAGITSLILGYRLFCIAGTPGHRAAGGSTEAEASVLAFKLSLKGAAPGTCFASFGAVILCAALVTGSPSVILENLRESARSENADFADLAERQRIEFRQSLTDKSTQIRNDYQDGIIGAEGAFEQLYKLVSTPESEDPQ
ncbi:hypothetical protein ACFL6M_06845 [Candidatus Eisenbacteria bacterium]|uniref:MotA/TolQ/ExbB proton channel domain-containing protein n=1 Tax=Eiseniibacteriota bacterium TaxID=2212470 RepID=A0ABV6YLT9_UNCEI